MAAPELLRAIIATGAAALGGGLSFALGAPASAAMLTALIACVGTWLTLANRAEASAIPLPQPPAAARHLDVRDLIDAIDEPLLIIDRQVVERANPAAQRLLGAHIIGEDIRLAIRHPAAADRLALRSGISDSGPIELTGLGDRERRWELFVHDLAGDTRLVRLRDRTGAYAAERMRVDFVANASHELRTPLATLLGFIETLEDQNAVEDAATRSRFLGIMFGEAKRMQQLIDDLISLSRIEAEKFRPPQEALELARLIEEVRAAIRSGRPTDERRLRVEIDDEVSPVAGDHIQLSQLLHNVIGNALKYGRADAAVRIKLSNARGDMVRLTVADEGDGIPPEHLPRLTERFYRVDPGRSRALGGTGLGLAIVKHIVERHRGRLDVESEVGRGTTVSVLLPVAGKPLS